ncbi:hypothetical protein Pelo_9349 [Pelomyxa schiedti]|nr:hypothetical protein Pelo_9349 [Pelomyxa schiedti]
MARCLPTQLGRGRERAGEGEKRGNGGLVSYGWELHLGGKEDSAFLSGGSYPKHITRDKAKALRSEKGLRTSYHGSMKVPLHQQPNCDQQGALHGRVDSLKIPRNRVSDVINVYCVEGGYLRLHQTMFPQVDLKSLILIRLVSGEGPTDQLSQRSVPSIPLACHLSTSLGPFYYMIRSKSIRISSSLHQHCTSQRDFRKNQDKRGECVTLTRRIVPRVVIKSMLLVGENIINCLVLNTTSPSEGEEVPLQATSLWHREARLSAILLSESIINHALKESNR